MILLKLEHGLLIDLIKGVRGFVTLRRKEDRVSELTRETQKD